MDVSMDVFVSQFSCFLPMTERRHEGLSAGSWGSPFGDDLLETLEAQPFDSVFAVLGPIFEA